MLAKPPSWILRPTPTCSGTPADTRSQIRGTTHQPVGHTLAHVVVIVGPYEIADVALVRADQKKLRFRHRRKKPVPSSRIMAVGKRPDYWFAGARMKLEDVGNSAFKRARARSARRMVSTGLTLYYQSILNQVKNDTPSFVSRMLIDRAGKPGPRGASEYPASDRRC